MDGWIKLHRRFLEWEWFDDPNMIKIFIFLLLSANHETKKWKGTEVKRGQLITGLHSLHIKTGLSIRTIRTCLSKLQKTGEIDKQSDNRFTVITLSNYDDYQQRDEISDKQPDKQATSKRQASDNKQEGKKERKKEIYKEEGHLHITWDEMNKLIDDFGIEKAEDYVNQVLNYRKNSKYKSLYLTARKWINKDIEKSQMRKQKSKLAI